MIKSTLLFLFTLTAFGSFSFAAGLGCPIVNGTFSATVLDDAKTKKTVKFVTEIKNGVPVYTDYNIKGEPDYIENAIADNKKYSIGEDGETQRTKCLSKTEFVVYLESPKANLAMLVKVNSNGSIDYYIGEKATESSLEHLVPIKAMASPPVMNCPTLQGKYNCEGEMLPIYLKTQKLKGVTTYEVNSSKFIADGKSHVSGAGLEYAATCGADGVKLETFALEDPNPKCEGGYTRGRTIFSFAQVGLRLLYGQANFLTCENRVGEPINDFKSMCDLDGQAQKPLIINGTSLSKTQMTGMGEIPNTCTMTLIGPKTVLTAAHCIVRPNRSDLKKTFRAATGKNYTATMTPDPQYDADHDGPLNIPYDMASLHDVALGILDSAPTDLEPISITSREPKINDIVLFAGRGAPTFQRMYGASRVITVSTQGFTIRGFGDVPQIADGGDSGGPSLIVGADNSVSIFGVMSTSTRTSDWREELHWDEALPYTMGASRVITKTDKATFIESFAAKNSLQICGLNLRCKPVLKPNN